MSCGGACHIYLCFSNAIAVWPAWYCWNVDIVPVSILLLLSMVMSSVFHASESSALHGLPGLPLFKTLPHWALVWADRVLATLIVVWIVSQTFYWSRQRMEEWIRREPLLPCGAILCWTLGELLGCHWLQFIGLYHWCQPLNYVHFHSMYHILAYLSVMRAIQYARDTHPLPPKNSTKMI